MTRGIVGTRNLNQVLQQLLNPPSPEKPEITRAGMILRIGDRVIQLRNDYNRQIYNGDLGIVKAIDTIEKLVTIQVDDREVEYDYADLNEIALAWSISIHKSQAWRISRSHNACFDVPLCYAVTESNLYRTYPCQTIGHYCRVNQGHRTLLLINGTKSSDIQDWLKG